jgi:hypothetical protein
MRAPPEVLPPPAIVAARDCYESHFLQAWQPLLNSLSKAKVWHRLGKYDPIIPRAQLIDRCYAISYLKKISDSEKWSDRDVALQVVFLNSFILTIAGMKTITAAEKKDLADSYRKQARRLRYAATWLERRDPASEPASEEAAEHGQAVKRVAVWCEKEADEIDDKDPNKTFFDNTLVVSRHSKGAPPVRAFCIKIAELMRLLYGKVLYETVIAITHAALGAEVTKENLRYWCKKGVNKEP